MVNTYLNSESKLPHFVLATAFVLFLIATATAEEKGSLLNQGMPGHIRKVFDSITGKDIITHARVLSDQAFRGREAGKAGDRNAAQYVADEFRKAGLNPGGSAGSFFQSFKIRVGYSITAEMKAWIGQSLIGEFKRSDDYMPLRLPGGKAEVNGECILAGYGISSQVLGFDEYKGINAKGKVVIVFSGLPWSGDKADQLQQKTDINKLATLAYKARNAADHGAACMFIVDNPIGWRKQLAVPERMRIPDADLLPNIPIPVVQITREYLSKLSSISFQELRSLAKDIADDNSIQSMQLKGRKVLLKAAISGQARLGRNIIGIMPGSDPLLKKEAVVMGAHYDHLGEGDKTIYFGANDNAAGVGALIVLAKAFTEMKVPLKRTVVLIAFDAEEIGRMGSKHYISRPCIPIDKTNLMINMDMIGKNEPDGINAVGTRSSKQLHRIHQELNRYVGLRLTHPMSYRLGLSDHSPFYYAKVPILYLFGGLDPDYNSPEDTWDKLIPEKVEKVARLAFLTAIEAGNLKEGFRFEKKEDLEWKVLE